MNVARFFNILFLLFGATMVVVLGVVCLMFLIYMDESASMREQWPTLRAATFMFGVLTLAAGAAFQGLRKQTRWMWPAQAVLAIVTVGIGVILKSFLLG